MTQVSRRLNTLMKQLRVPTPEEVKDIFEQDSEEVAEIVRESLENVIKQIQQGSQTGALDGYIAVKRKADGSTKLFLRDSGIDLSGEYEWVIFTAPSAQHDELGLNLFNLLDRGRPQLPVRPPSEGPYPLWGVLANVSRSNSRIDGKEGSLRSGRNPSLAGDFRQEPRQQNQRGNISFSQGPLAAVPGKHLYEAALRRAKDRLTVKGLNRQWDVLKVGFE